MSQWRIRFQAQVVGFKTEKVHPRLRRQWWGHSCCRMGLVSLWLYLDCWAHEYLWVVFHRRQRRLNFSHGSCWRHAYPSVPRKQKSNHKHEFWRIKQPAVVYMSQGQLSQMSGSAKTQFRQGWSQEWERCFRYGRWPWKRRHRFRLTWLRIAGTCSDNWVPHSEQQKVHNNQ